MKSHFFAKSETSHVSVNNSLISDAEHVLDLMSSQARKVAHENNYSPPSYGSSAQADRMYYSTHFAKVKLTDLDMSEARFFAIQDLIELAARDGASSSRILRDHQLAIEVRCGMADLEIQAHYTHELSQRAFINKTELFAPIAKVPFDDLKTVFNEYMQDVFNKLTIYPTTHSNIDLHYSTENAFFYDLDRFKKIETICKNVDKSFNLGVDIDFPKKCLSVNKIALEKAKAMILPSGEPRLAINKKMDK